MKKSKPHSLRILITEFDKGGYHLFLNVKINGKRCRFLIDTGASKSVVDKSYFEKYFGKNSLVTVKQETTGVHGSVPESHFGKIKQIEIGKKVVKNYMAAAIDLSHVNLVYSTLKKPKIQGILGSDLMLKYKMVVDYGNECVTIP
jgi:predicted aspartyl protease